MSNFLAIDIQGELARQLINVIGLLILGFVGWAARRFYKGAEEFQIHLRERFDQLTKRLDHLDKCIDELKEDGLFQVSSIRMDIAYLKGKTEALLKQDADD